MLERKDVAIWLRVSTDMQVTESESLQNHEARARMYAASRGWDVVEVYHLEAVSGKSVMNHPETKRMLSDIKKGKVSGLIFSKLARLARNTRELLEFAEYFKQHGADLISLQESIDTSSPAGKLLYTMIAALAEWERNEISDRVKASVPVRAKMGKSLGGAAPYGYKWVNQKLELEKEEANVRKLMYEIFLECRRIKKTARILNERGYRTRKGNKFRDSTVRRLLSDPIAKGMRRMNYTKSKGDGMSWDLKDESEWIFNKVPAIISEEIWNETQQILNVIYDKFKRMGRVPVHLFTGYAKCECGEKMYVFKKLKKYCCRKCKNKIPTDDLEAVFTSQIEHFLFSEDDITLQLKRNESLIQDKEQEVINLQEEVQSLDSQLKELLGLFQQGHIPKEGFKDYHEPLFSRKKQILLHIPELQGEIDAMKTAQLSSDKILQDARNLQSQWHTLSFQEKRSIVENVLTEIIIGDKEVEITLAELPTIRDASASLKNGCKRHQTYKGS